VSVMEGGALQSKPRKRPVHDFVLRIGPPCHAQQYVRINKTRRNRHLVVVLVEPLTRNSFGQWRDLVRKLGQRVQPFANLFLSVRLPSLDRASQQSGQNLLHVGLKRQATRLGHCRQFVGNINRNYHERTLARTAREG
jgi:hypothetical protein